MTQTPSDLLPSGVPGLDEVLHGGLRAGRIYLVEGSSGTGKTTLGLQFLIEGTRRGETGLFIALAETALEVEALARSHGWDLEGIEVAGIPRPAEPELGGTLFDVSEVELDERIAAVLRQLEARRPVRVVLDTLSSLRAYGERPARFRRAVETLRRRMLELGCTVVVADELAGDQPQLHPYSLAWGVVRLEQDLDAFGPVRRRLCVVKIRGQDFATGYHDVRIARGGLRVYARLAAARPTVAVLPEPISSGIAQIDRLLGGGLERGSSVGVIGPPGCGKSTLVSQYALAAAERGERTAIYLFEESETLLLRRAESQGYSLAPHLASDRVRLRSLGLGEASGGEFAAELVQSVDEGVSLVVIDSLNGLRQALSGGAILNTYLLTLLRQLNARGAVTFLTLAQRSLFGAEELPPADLSYLADTVIAQRYFEAAGEIRFALSVLKKRYGEHERSIREYRITGQGLEVGEPLSDFRGVLTGVPEYLGSAKPLL